LGLILFVETLRTFDRIYERLNTFELVFKVAKNTDKQKNSKRSRRTPRETKGSKNSRSSTASNGIEVLEVLAVLEIHNAQNVFQALRVEKSIFNAG